MLPRINGTADCIKVKRIQSGSNPGCVGEAQNTCLPEEERNPYLIVMDKNTGNPCPAISSQSSPVNNGAAMDQDRQLAKLEAKIHGGNTCK